MNRENNNRIAYSANDIARLLVRNPDELTRFVTYNRICDKYCDGMPIEDLPKEVKDYIFSQQAAAEDLAYLGYSDAQIDKFFQAVADAYNELDIDNIPSDAHPFKMKERVLFYTFALASFPYGPPIFSSTPAPYNVMASRNFSVSRTRSTLSRLQSYVAGNLMDLREQDPRILMANSNTRHHEPAFDTEPA